MPLLVKAFLDIALFRRGPQDLPPSSLLLLLALAFHLFGSTALSVTEYSPWQALLAGIVDTVVLVLLAGTLLISYGKKERLTQTLTALAGTGGLISLAAIPLVSLLAYLKTQDLATDVPILFLLLLIIWSIAIVGNILRHALSVGPGLGTGLSLVFYIMAVTAHNALFTTPGAQ